MSSLASFKVENLNKPLWSETSCGNWDSRGRNDRAELMVLKAFMLSVKAGSGKMMRGMEVTES